MLIEMTLVPAMLERDRMCEMQDPVDVETGQFETSVPCVAQRRPVVPLGHQVENMDSSDWTSTPVRVRSAFRPSR